MTPIDTGNSVFYLLVIIANYAVWVHLAWHPVITIYFIFIYSDDIYRVNRSNMTQIYNCISIVYNENTYPVDRSNIDLLTGAFHLFIIACIIYTV